MDSNLINPHDDSQTLPQPSEYVKSLGIMNNSTTDRLGGVGDSPLYPQSYDPVEFWQAKSPIEKVKEEFGGAYAPIRVCLGNIKKLHEIFESDLCFFGRYSHTMRRYHLEQWILDKNMKPVEKPCLRNQHSRPFFSLISSNGDLNLSVIEVLFASAVRHTRVYDGYQSPNFSPGSACGACKKNGVNRILGCAVVRDRFGYALFDGACIECARTDRGQYCTMVQSGRYVPHVSGEYRPGYESLALDPNALYAHHDVHP